MSAAALLPLSGRLTNAENLQRILASGVRLPIAHPQWSQWRIEVGGFTPEADTQQDLLLHTLFPSKALPDRIVPLVAYARLEDAFTGGTVSAVALDFGHGTVGGVPSDADGYLDAIAVGSGTTLTTYTSVMASRGDVLDGTPSPLVRLSTTDGNIDDLTAGSVEVGLLWCQLPLPLPAGS